MDKKKQIKLNEAQLREFISYSVARILKEEYGYGTFTIEPDLDEYLDELEEGNDEADAFVRKLMEYDVWPVRVRIIYSVTKGMKGDNYLVPDDPDEYMVEDWEIINKENIKDDAVKDLLHQMVEKYMEDFDLEAELDWKGMLQEENRGIMTHFGSDDGYEPKNPYEGMTWEEYCKAKEKERGCQKKKKYGDEGNKGITTHF